MFSLDLETSPKDGDLSNGYALEPWRLRQGKAYISSIAVTSDDGFHAQIKLPTREQLIDLLTQLAGKEVYAHNALFDVAWLIAAIEPDKLKHVPQCVLDVRWRDTMLLARWCANGRPAEDRFFSYALVNLIASWMPNEPGAAEFIALKQNAPLAADNPYWLRRGLLDVEFTLKLAKFLLTKLPKECWRGFVTEQRAIPQMANSWLIGFCVDVKALEQAAIEVEQNIVLGLKEVGISREAASSPTQLANILFNQWGLSPLSYTAKGKAQTDAETLKILQYQTKDPRLTRLMRVRENLTLASKYINTAYQALQRSGDGYMYPIPRMFGTSSGRLTYSNETIKDSGMKVSIAAHQIPRKDKIIRRFLKAPEGHMILRCDANAQESRWMAIWSRDPTMLRIFGQGLNFHSYMASEVYATPYEEFMRLYEGGDARANEQRQYGKLINLACNFRIGGAKLAKKAFTEYDTWMEESQGRYFVNFFQRTYPGVPAYWRNIIAFAREHNYSYTIAQRRYKVNGYMATQDQWRVEGTIISHPIQGSAGEQFYATLSQAREARIISTLHDATYFLVDCREEGIDIAHRINQTPYQDIWQQEIPVMLPYDSSFGLNFSELK